MIKKLALGLLFVVALFAGYGLYGYYGSVDIGTRLVTIIIEPGDRFSDVADELVASGVVNSRTMLYYPAQLRKIDRKLTPGRYDFAGENSCKSVLDRLEAADFLRLKVTIVEGAPIWRVASTLQKVMEVDSAALIALNTDSAFLASVNLPYLEGYLMPQTYFFPWGMSLEDMVRQIIEMYHQQVDPVWSRDIPNGLSQPEVIILASIVEAEARLDDEKPKIASVYHNRLRKGWKLDADPTVIYGLGGLDRPLYRGDIRKDTPYNTYLRRGLPPTPINSPGVSAIQATLHPAGTDYMFFVADGTGRHRFSRTNAEHNRARREVRQNQNNGSDN
jgi:UPF0755 protein